MSQASIYHWYEYKISRNSVELMCGCDALTTMLTKQLTLTQQ